MWTVLILLNLWTLFGTVSSSPPSPTNVIFQSVNLRNVLQWSPGNGTPNDTVFTVQYAIYGDSVKGSRGKRVNWRPVRHCTEIVRYWCDLSNETWDLGEGYHARVQAVSRRDTSKWAPTLMRFDPKSDTTFGPPLVSVDLEDNNAVIYLKGPMRYQPNDALVVSMETIYGQMTYNLSVHNVRHGMMTHFPVTSSPYKYRLLEYDTEYCFSAKTRFIYIPIHCQPSEWHCRTTPPDPWITQMRRIIVGIVVPCACICMLVVICYLLYQYLSGKGQKSPYILDQPSFNAPPQTFLPSESLNTVLIKVGPPSDHECRMPHSAYAKKQQQILDPKLTYAHHQPAIPPQPEEPWENSSLDYGFVGKAPEHNTSEEVSGVSSPQAQSYLLQKSTCTETRMMHTQTEVSELLQTNTCLPFNSVASLSFEDREDMDRKLVNQSSHASFFGSPFNVNRRNEGGTGDEFVRGETGGNIDEGSSSERAALLSAYASQIVTNMATSQSDQSDFLPDDYGVLCLAEASLIEKDEELEEEGEDEGTTCVDWDPSTGKLVLPEVEALINKNIELMQGEKRRENQAGKEEMEEKAKGKPRLENVYVRQGSEEKAEALRETEKGEETGWEADDPLTKWNLVISMDQ